MGFKNFLEKLQSFLDTGYLDIPGKECQVPDPVQRIVLACSLFERESYKNLGNVSSRQYSFFSQIFTATLTSISPEVFAQSASSLDSKSKDFILRGIEYSSQEFPLLDLSCYSKSLSF